MLVLTSRPVSRLGAALVSGVASRLEVVVPRLAPRLVVLTLVAMPVEAGAVAGVYVDLSTVGVAGVSTNGIPILIATRSAYVQGQACAEVYGVTIVHL